MQTNAPAPAGWYPDPDVPGHKRYWDGRAWTPHRVAGEPAAGNKGPWFLIPLVVVLVVLAASVVASLAAPKTELDAASTTTVTTAAPIVAAPVTTERVTTTTTEPTTTTTRPRPTTTTTTRPRPTTTVDPLAGDRAAMGAWAAVNQSLITDLQSATNDMAAKASDLDPTGLALACADLSNGVDAAKAADRIPIEEVDVHWQAALYHYGLGADACIEGATLLDSDKLNESASEIGQGGDELTKASAAMQGYLP